MNYDNQPCRSCGEIMHENDDIVVCPVCATPQHRSCWMQNGHCINEELHSSGYVWEREKAHTQSATFENEPVYDTLPSGVCHICGSENPEEALHCGNCGALMSEEHSANENKTCQNCGKVNDPDAIHCNQCGFPLNAGSGFYSTNPYLAGTGMSADEKIGEYSADDISLFVRNSARRYLPKFKKIAEGKKFSFNWAAFIFSPHWFFYRKMYKPGIAFLAIFATASLVISGIFAEEIKNYANIFYDVTAQMESADSLTTEEYLALEKKLEDSMKEMAVPIAVQAGANIIFGLICALIANKLYYKKILDDMKLINDSVREENLRKMMITRRGGSSVMGFATSLLGYNVLIELLSYAADMLTNLL